MEFDFGFLGVDFKASEDDVRRMFKKTDITVKPSPFDWQNATQEQVELYRYIREQTKRIWRQQRHKIGDWSRPGDYDDSQFPPAMIAKADVDYIVGHAMKLLAALNANDPFLVFSEKTDDYLIGLIANFAYSVCEDILAAQEDYAAEHGKTPDELTEEERLAPVDKIAEDLLEREMRVLDCGQGISAILDAMKKLPAAEDFSGRADNHARTDFERRYYHSRAKTKITYFTDEEGTDENGNPLPFDAVNPDDMAELAQTRVDLYNAVQQLDEMDRKIIELRMRDLSQAEIAKALNISQSAVSKRLKKMQDRFRCFLS